MPTCIIKSCAYWKLGKARHPDITLHVFPSTARRIRKWLKQTGHKFKDIDAFVGRILENGSDGDYRICSAHFAKDSYKNLGGTKVLKANAMPTIFPAGSKLIYEACRRKITRKSHRNVVKPPKPGSTKKRMTPALTKADTAMQTECCPSMVHRGVQTEERFSLSNKTQERSSVSQPAILPHEENCQSEDMTQNGSFAALGQGESGHRVTERILKLTLEIIYLLTGERPDLGGRDKNQSLPMKSKTPFLKVERSNGQKILDVTQKIIELLTGKVPIRCQDVAVYFSMEECEYLGHKWDLYKDVTMEDQPPLASPDSSIENTTQSPNPSPAFIENDKGPHFSESACKKIPQSLSACVKEEIVSDEERFPGPEVYTTKHHQRIPSFHGNKQPLLDEEHCPKSKVSKATHRSQAATSCIKGHLIVKDRLPGSCMSPPPQNTQPDIKDGPLSDEEHLLNSEISSPTHRRQSQATVVKGSLSDVEDLNPTISTLIQHTHPITIKEEMLPDKEHLPKPEISSTTRPRLCRTIQVNKGSLSDEDLLNPIISTLRIKEEVLPAKHLPNPKISLTTRRRPCGTIQVNKRSLLDEEDLLNPTSSTLIHHTQPKIINIKKEVLPDKEHLSNPKILPTLHCKEQRTICDSKGSLSDEGDLINPTISTPIHHTQPTNVHIKEETLPDKEHLPKVSSTTHQRECRTICTNKGSLSDAKDLLNPVISALIHHTQPTTIHFPEEMLPDKEHLPNPKMSPLTHHRQPGAIHTKEESLSGEEHLPNPKISPITCCRQRQTSQVHKGSLSDEEDDLNPAISTLMYHTQPTTVHIKEETLPDKEHLPNPKMSPVSHHRQHRTIHAKEESLSDKEHLLNSEISTPKHHTEPTTVHIKEEPVLAEEHLSDEMDYTTIIINEDSMSSDEECHSHSTSFIIQGQSTFSQAKKQLPSDEEEPSSPIQYIPVQINDDFLESQKHLQQSVIHRHSKAALVEEVPLLSKGRPYVDKSSSKCDEDLSIIPLKLLPARTQRTFLSDEERSLFCPECGKSFTDRARVEAHLRSHWGEKPYSCSLCLKGFRSKSKLLIHQMMHSGEKPYACSECGKCFAQNAYLQRHIKGHTGEKPFPCSICGKCFACRSDMIKHEFTHTGARPHPCALCGKRFTKKSHLNRHMRIHTGEKPFCCPDCGRSFGCNSDMVSHQRIHQGVKPFSCSECGKSFLRKQDAQRHQTIHR